MSTQSRSSPKKMKENQVRRNARRVDQLVAIRNGTFNNRSNTVFIELRIAGLIEYPYDKITGDITGPVKLTDFGHAFLKHHGRGE